MNKLTPSRRPSGTDLLARRISALEHEVLPEMIDSLGTLTLEGQRHVMTKVVACLRRHVDVGDRDHAELMDVLAVEADRRVPNVDTFRARTSGLFLGARARPPALAASERL